MNNYIESLLRTSHLATTEMAAIGESGIELHRAALKQGGTPDIYRSLCDALKNLAMLYRYLHQDESAHARQEEALNLMAERYRQDPAEHEIDYAEILKAHSVMQAYVGDHQSASIEIANAISIYRRAAALRPDAFQMNLRTSLTTAASFAMNRKEPQEALELISECIDLGYSIEAANATTTNTLRGITATQMFLLHRAHLALGDEDSADAALMEAIRRRRSMETLDDDDSAELGQWINKHAFYLVNESRAREALPYCKEAVRILEPFVPMDVAYAIEFARAKAHLGLAIASMDSLTRDDQEQAILECNDALARFRALPSEAAATNDSYIRVLLESLIHLYDDTGKRTKQNKSSVN